MTNDELRESRLNSANVLASACLNLSLLLRSDALAEVQQQAGMPGVVPGSSWMGAAPPAPSEPAPVPTIADAVAAEIESKRKRSRRKTG